MASDLFKSDDGNYYYSYSTLSNMAVCPARLYFKRLVKEKGLPVDLNLPMIFGSAVHKGIEERLKFERNPYTVADQYIEQTLEEAGQLGNAVIMKEYTDKQALKQRCIENFESSFYPSLREQLTDPEHQVELRLETPFRKGVLVGVIDVAMPGIFADWKTGQRVPSDFSLMMNPQSGFYFHLAQKCDMEPPKEFVYVYLNGKNMAYKNSASGRAYPNKQDPQIRYSFPVYPTEESTKSLLNNFIIPLAKSFEDGVLYKNPSDFNCGGCLYRSICAQTDLPTKEDYD